jgi:hypothetical protein
MPDGLARQLPFLYRCGIVTATGRRDDALSRLSKLSEGPILIAADSALKRGFSVMSAFGRSIRHRERRQWRRAVIHRPLSQGRVRGEPAASSSYFRPSLRSRKLPSPESRFAHRVALAMHVRYFILTLPPSKDNRWLR